MPSPKLENIKDGVEGDMMSELHVMGTCVCVCGRHESGTV